MTDYNDGKWHGWNGDTPAALTPPLGVHPKSLVQFVCMEGDRMKDVEAGLVGWAHSADTSKHRKTDVVAFRVTKPHREPRELWIIGSSAHNSYADAQEFLRELVRHHPGKGYDLQSIIHFREVLE
jgi:hypothetical protein